VADDFDRELRDALRAEASQWSPASPLDETRRILPERVARRRRHQAVTGATIVAALLVVVLVAATPGGGGDATVQLAGRIPSTAATSAGAANPPAPGGGYVCAAACSAGPPVDTPAPAISGPPASGPRQGRIATTVPVTRPDPPVTGPRGSTEPPTVVVTTVPPTTTPPTGPPGPPTRYTEADSGRTVQVNAHAGFIISLGAECAATQWTAPVTSDPAVVARVSASVDPTAGTATAVFTPVSAGSVQITARLLRASCASVPGPFVLTVEVIGPSGNPSPTPKPALHNKRAV
jgi:hypothetical protein